MEHHGLLGDTHFWVLISTVLFAALAYTKGRGPVLAMLDSRSARIKAQLDEAETLRTQAQALLAETERQYKDAQHTAAQIIAQAQATASRLETDAAQQLQDAQKRREEHLLERIARAESQAVSELRRQAADLATKAAEQLLRDAANKNSAALVNEAINEIPAKL